MNKILNVLTATTIVAAAAVAAPAAATAAESGVAATWSCRSIQYQHMEFEAGSPWHAEPLGSSPVRAYGGGWQGITASCVNSHGNQWWRSTLPYTYIWDGYRIG